MSDTKTTSMAKPAVVEAIIALAAAVPAVIVRNSCFLFSLVMTVIFYLPALKNGSVNAGFLYTGDMLGWYLPALAKTHALLHSFNFSAIDYSTFNGSSDFFLSPNFFAYHPFVVIYCLFVLPETSSVQQLGRFLVLLLVIHSFFACYFSLKLFTRFFAFEFGSAALIATVFAFSMHMLNAMGQPPFFICASIVPWAAYAALAHAERPGLRQLIFACLPILIGFMGGYMPMGVASLALSAFLVAAKVLYVDESEVQPDRRLRILFLAWLPYVCASIIVGPYLYSVYKFHQETSSVGVVSLFYSAHQMAQLPQSLLNVISKYFSVPGRVIEFPLRGGFIVIATAAIFFLSRKSIDRLTSHEWKVFKIAAIIYFATVLAIFGDYSAVSDLVYYLVPQVGGMHLYERFLLPAHLIFAAMLALMLKAVIQERPLITTKIAFGMFVAATLVTAYMVAYKPALSQEIGLNNYLVFELFLGFLFLCALIVPGNNFAYLAAIILIYLPPLDRMYDDSLRANTLEAQVKRQPISLDDGIKKKIVSYFKRHSDKAIIKYVDITPMWTPGSFSNIVGGIEYFPKVFPDYVLNELNLSSYGGFTFYLSARADYMRRMPVIGEEIIVSPDWEYLKKTGADFLVARESDLQSGALVALFEKTKTEDILRLPNNVVIVPLLAQADKARSFGAELFDNGYFKISAPIKETNGNLVNIALGKPARQSSNAGADAKLAVDGNTKGDFSLGSVSHTLRDVNAWFEIDLGSTEPINNVTIWNRTDCCGYCLRDYWLFISDKPFKSSDAASDLKGRPGTWSQQNSAPNPKGTVVTEGVRGRYVRIQLPGDTQTTKDCFLSLAEVEVFRSNESPGAVKPLDSMAVPDLKINRFNTNHANYLLLDFVTSAPVAVQYLFFDNPRLKYYLNGKRVSSVEKEDSRIINVKAGHNTIEIQYRHWPLVIFWIFYTLYALLFLWALIPGRFLGDIWRKLHKS